MFFYLSMIGLYERRRNNIFQR